MNDLKIVHIAKHSHNIGEGALIDGMHRMLTRDMGSKISFDRVDRKRFQAIAGNEFKDQSLSARLDDSYAESLNKSASALILGGGGIFQTGTYDSLGGMCLAGDLSALEKLKIPIVVYAAGDNRLKDSYKFEYVDGLNRLLEILSHSKRGLFSLRNDGSKERFLEIIEEKYHGLVHEIPDPGLYVSRSSHRHPLIRADCKNIVVQLAGDRIGERFSLPDNREDSKQSEVLAAIADCLIRLNEKYRLNIIIAPHIPTDFAIVADFLKVCDKRLVGNSSMTRELIDVSWCARGVEAAPDFFSLYDQADLAVGMRGHAAICSVGLDTPFIGLDTHEKVGGFLRKMGLSKWILSPLDTDFGEKLYRSCDDLLHSRGEWSRIRAEAYSECRKTTRAFHKDFETVIKS
ncbi:MAG: polysaccharide pyruvyl transferase family protein [Pseudomonadota bacterium]|nr:polysaccharide pyruvyl transferase family protein [Pseudomonadota bacterium]